MERIIEDKRTITAIWFTDDSHYGITNDNVDIIEAYQEPGLHERITWFAIIKNDEVVARANSLYVSSVSYN